VRVPCFGVIVLLAAASAFGQEPAKFFEDNCALCHAIGGPPGGAPDLKDVTRRRDRRWLIRFILNPEEVVKTDPEAAALVKQYDGMVMPATDGATVEIVERLLRYIDRASDSPSPAEPAESESRAASALDVAAGHDLYEGRRPLTRGAPACVSCHRLGSIGGLGGGTLGPDLTRVEHRLGGAGRLTKWLSNPPTRVMRAVFRAQPLADQEAFLITAALTDERPHHAAANSWYSPLFVLLGVAGALAGLAVMGIVWSSRMSAIRRPLIARARLRVGDEP
jgi:mono/diheme cytochrome c family protein